METLLSLCVGIGLSAACGFRVFIPMLIVSIASHAGHLHLSSGFQWIGSDAALIAFAIAAVLEITGYYVPWVDNLLDTIATPAAIVAGTILTASFITDVSPFFKWATAIIAGGSVAGLIQTATVFARGTSSFGTGGLANPVLATVEMGGSFIASILALFVPFLLVVLIAVGLFFLGKRLLGYRARRVAETIDTPA